MPSQNDFSVYEGFYFSRAVFLEKVKGLCEAQISGLLDLPFS